MNDDRMKLHEVYEALVAALPPEYIDHHESDLYVKATPVSTKIIHKAHIPYGMVETFEDQITHTTWYDIAFAYVPWWEERIGK